MGFIKKKYHTIEDELNAYQAQNRLFENLFKMTRSPSTDGAKLKAAMKETLRVATDIAGAENGSLFLLDKNGIVTDTILSRGEVGENEQNRLVGSVLGKGLAGWVKENLKVGHIKDTRVDTRWHSFKNQPYTVGSAISIPIIRHDLLFGILTLIHSKPGHFKKDMINLVQITADQMAVALENAQLYSRLEDSYRSLEKAKSTIEAFSETLSSELERGQKMQEGFFPSELPKVQGGLISAYFHPALQLCGDFYDAFLMPENRLCMVIADVSGKGTGSALFMALTRSLIRIFSGYFESYPSDRKNEQKVISTDTILSAVTRANAYVCQEHGAEAMFVTLFFGVLDLETGRLSYINCGHEPLMIINPDGIKARLKASGLPIGVISPVSYDIQTADLKSGDILLGVTDGVTEARSPNGELYMRERIEASVLRSSKDSAHELIQGIKNDLSAFTEGAAQADDITILAVQKTGF